MRCLECLINASKRDSITQVQKEFINYQETVIQDAWKTRDNAVKRKKRSTTIGASIGGVGGLLLGIFFSLAFSK